jgi:hypothetical protein
MFGRGLKKTECWDARVTGMGSQRADDAASGHLVSMVLRDGTTRRLHVRRKLWDSLHTGDTVRKARGTRQLARAA